MVRCVDCGAEFEFTEREQQHYAEKGWGQPRRCKNCRAKRKPATAAHNPNETDFNDGDTTIIAAPAKFKVNCSACGMETIVPFKPDPNRPVYCRSCLAKAKAAKSMGRT
jgi:CxxC-x17-CxxC domain-containing protein